MSLSFDISIDVSEHYDFKKESLDKLEQNLWVKNQWPIIYFIYNDSKKLAYVGESTNARSRIKNHLSNSDRTILNKISIIGCDKFNKSVTLDIESKLIQYISSEGTYALQNGNHGLLNHNYYQQHLYQGLFKEIWEKLRSKKIVSKSIEAVENSELFKFSPYKSLNEDQYTSVLNIIDGLCRNNVSRIFVNGSAGTGKTVLATYLIKLLNTKVSGSDMDEFRADELHEINLIHAFQNKYPNAKIGFVVAMTSLRESLKNVFRNIPGLSASMILSPSDTFKQKYDLLIVDEAHRLRQYKNIGWRGTFKKNNRKLKLDDTGNELDWIIANSKKQIFFYDASQSVKPSDIDQSDFASLLLDKNSRVEELKSQMRIKGGSDYITFVDDLLNIKREEKRLFAPKNYELFVFESLNDMYEQLALRENKYGLSRLIAGYSWPWLSKEDKNAVDIEIDGLKFQWNQTDKDWINSESAFKEIGCIHTTQGYDLNYAGIIFGEEISLNTKTGQIEINKEKYYDQYGKKGIDDIEKLKSYIINIYKTIMYRGIKGTFIYACDKNLRDYFKKHIRTYSSQKSIKYLEISEAIPYTNSIPLFDLKAAAGNFSALQTIKDCKWIVPTANYKPSKDLFACKIEGESMNKIIPNGSICLFRKYSGGSRNGKIVLVEHSSIQDPDYGSGYTVKEYHSQKISDGEQWSHEKITLKPLSTEPKFAPMEFHENEAQMLKVIGIFVDVLT